MNTVVRKLYKDMMRNAKNFRDYNFREYAIRRVRLGFDENKGVSDVEKTSALIADAKKSLELLKRQSILNQMYTVGEYVAEKGVKK